jgi:predicted RNA-binding protein with PUA-like domain
MAESFWLLKTEPETFSIDDLAAAPQQTTSWEGVRNYQARNMLRDDFSVGDRVLVYHSVKNPSVVGTATVVRAGYPDHFAWDRSSHYFDPKSNPDQPTWFMVDIRFDKKLPRPLPLAELREMAVLKEMELLRKGSRLSVQPVRKKEWNAILKKGGLL